MSYILQNIVIMFALIGVGHTIILMLAYIQKRHEWIYDVQPTLAFLTVLFTAVVLYTIAGDL